MINLESFQSKSFMLPCSTIKEHPFIMSISFLHSLLHLAFPTPIAPLPSPPRSIPYPVEMCISLKKMFLFFVFSKNLGLHISAPHRGFWVRIRAVRALWVHFSQKKQWLEQWLSTQNQLDPIPNQRHDLSNIWTIPIELCDDFDAFTETKCFDMMLFVLIKSELSRVCKLLTILIY